jgi:hypothetical protein
LTNQYEVAYRKLIAWRRDVRISMQPFGELQNFFAEFFFLPHLEKKSNAETLIYVCDLTLLNIM